MFVQILLVAIGGFFGSILRFFIANWLQRHLAGTLIANITGSLLLALTYYFHSTAALSHALFLLLGIGFCGAYTTFSAFGMETVTLIIDKKYKAAAQYVLATFGISISLIAVILMQR